MTKPTGTPMQLAYKPHDQLGFSHDILDRAKHMRRYSKSVQYKILKNDQRINEELGHAKPKKNKKITLPKLKFMGDT
jgi:hypothetical protein